MSDRVLVAGLGNVFLGDDGFGVEVVRRLAHQPLPPGVRVIDAGIRSLHLAFDLLDQPQLLLVIDTVRRGGTPGSLYLLEPILDGEGAVADGHAMDLRAVKAGVEALGGRMPPVLLVGCEPACLDEGLGLSAVVERSIEPALQMVSRVMAQGGTA
jgi:hydrogenase maturation protease